ncbi:MAG: hypothetical protein QME94_08520 [Anaerolineae bacterium]|nr:hypothetical protein [Anaerolineae bacterium]
MHIQRAIVRSFDAGTWRASVEILGAHTALLTGVPVAGDLGPGLLPPGTRVWVCLSEEGNPADAAVLVPYGAVPSPWVTSRLWRPTLASAVRSSPVTCSATAYEPVPGLSVSLAIEVASTVLLLMAGSGYLATAGISYTLALFHDDAHESSELAPVVEIGGSGAAAGPGQSLAALALQSGVQPGTHTFVVRHRVSAGSAVLSRGRVVALAMGG